MPGAYDVVSFGADPTGRVDAAGAFQDALNFAAAGRADDGSLPSNVVSVPAGIYRLDGPIRVPRYVTLEGAWRFPPDCGPSFPSPNQPVADRQWWDPATYEPFLHGSVIVTDYGRDIEDAADQPALITLTGPSSGVRGLWIYYPRQGIRERGVQADRVAPVIDYEVVPYQWTIRAESESCVVSDMLLQNSYMGIDFSRYGGRHMISRIWGQPLREGIRIGNCFDVGRILDVHFWPFWDHGADRKKADKSVSTVLREFTAQHGFALTLFKSDMQIVNNFFAFGYFVGVHLGFAVRRDPDTGEERIGACTGQFTNLNLDQCTNGIDFHSSDKSGVQITNANIVCRNTHDVDPTVPADDQADRHAVVAHHYPSASHEGLALPGGFLAIRGASVYGFTKSAMVAWESGNNTLMISSSWFKNEMDPAVPVGAPIIDVVRGRAIIQGNWFQHNNGGDAVRVGPEVAAAMIHGNLAENELAFPRTREIQAPPRIVDSDNILFQSLP